MANNVVLTLRDISNRKKAEEALRESERSCRDIFENSLIGMYRTTPDGQILMANRALLRMLGYQSYEELATRYLELEGFEPGYPRSQFKKRIEANGQIIGLKSAWRRRDGATLFVRESARAIRDKSGQTLYYQGTVEDISERKHGMAYELKADEHLGSLRDEVKTCLFRVTRELLTNVVKHAQARKIKVSALKIQDEIHVTVQDDGVGFDLAKIRGKDSGSVRFGLFSVREQLEHLGGLLIIESKPGRGTMATVVI